MLCCIGSIFNIILSTISVLVSERSQDVLASFRSKDYNYMTEVAKALVTIYIIYISTTVLILVAIIRHF